MPPSKVIRFKKREYSYHYAIEAYGVRIGVSTNSTEARKALKKRIAEVLPEFSIIPAATDVEHLFVYAWNPSGRDSLYRDGEAILSGRRREIVMDWFGSRVRLVAAEYAVDRVFIHSAAVCWKGKAILMPADSFKGKTALTAELVRRGAVYYSDEYSILDQNGFVHPFPKKLSIRLKQGNREQTERSVKALGGMAGIGPAPVGMILLTEFDPKAKWSPKKLTPARGVIEIIRNTLPIRRSPEFTMTVLRRAAENALIIQTRRGNAAEAANELLMLFENKCL